MSGAKRLISFTFWAAILAGLAIVFWQRQALLDWWRLRGYNPPPAIAALAANDTMTDSAKHVFYVNHPDLITEITELRNSCTQNEHTIVLGCYHAGQNGIFIFDVKDPRLEGVEQVTAAHEMLHASYERLSSDEKNYVNGLLNNFYNTGLNDERVKKTIELYRSTTPDELLNEMHSIFGTEVASLPPALESYYQRYFLDRSKVITFSAAYEDEFSGRLEQINAADAQLAGLKQKIESQEASLSTQSAELDDARNQLDADRDSGNITAYNAAIPAFNAKVNAYNKSIAQLQKDIAAYNLLVQSRNALAAEVKALQSAIDTRLTTQSTQ